MDVVFNIYPFREDICFPMKRQPCNSRALGLAFLRAGTRGQSGQRTQNTSNVTKKAATELTDALMFFS